MSDNADIWTMTHREAQEEVERLRDALERIADARDALDAKRKLKEA